MNSNISKVIPNQHIANVISYLLPSDHGKYDISYLPGQSLPFILVFFVTLLQYKNEHLQHLQDMKNAENQDIL